MSWLISQALMQDFENSRSSQALVAEYSEATCLDGEPSAPLSVMPTPHKFWRNDKTMEPCQLSRFGLMCAVLTEGHGEELLMWYLADSHARTLVLPGKEQELRAPALHYGRKCLGLLARFDRDSHSWKTPQCSLFEDLKLSLQILPRWGCMRNGECWELQISMPNMKEKEYGSWPTPLKSPRDSCLTMKSAISNQQSGSCQQNSLSFAVAKAEQEAGRHMPDGHLNPEWVEWLMGWPIGWTDLQPLGMDRFHEWRQQHSVSYQIAEKESKDENRS